MHNRQYRRSLVLLLLGSASVGASGCVGEFHSHSAYDSQHYVCDTPGALAAEYHQCTAPTCNGYLSMKGVLQGVPIVVESPLVNTYYKIFVDSQTKVQQLSESQIFGRPPYFAFQYKIESLGGDPSAAATAPRTLRVNPAGAELPPNPNDDQTDIALVLESGGASSSIQPRGGTLTLELATDQEFKATFDFDYGGGDHLQGCIDETPGQLHYIPM